MQSFNFPQEEDFKRWVREVIREELAKSANHVKLGINLADEQLITRKETAAYLKISLVTLNDWMKRGLPFHRKRGRVLFIKSEVLQYMKGS
jgi:excisionase family DNA binding protein